MAMVHCTQVAPARKPPSSRFPTASFCHEMRNYLQLLSVQSVAIAQADSSEARATQLARQMDLLSDSTGLLNLYCYRRECTDLADTELCLFAVVPVIQQVISAYPRFAGQIGVSICQEFSINGCPLLLKSLLHNLMRNAWRGIAVKPDMCVHIVLESRASGKYLVFIDSGTGIAAHQLGSIFQPLISYSEGGTGLGLAICQDIIQLFGGSMSCKSELGKYTAFQLCF
jgi:two-component system, autoinducer 1 sensor kinase/phosphatase LuxN